MTGRTLVLLFITLCSMQVFGQSNTSLKITPKLGINFADLLVGKPEVDVTLAKLGWNVGVDAALGRKVALGAGFHYYRLGSLIKMKDEDLTASLSSSQFKLPLGLNYRLISVDYLRVFVKGDLVLNYTFNLVEGELRHRVTEYNRVNLGTRLGLTIELSRFSLELNFEDSLTRLANDVKYTQNKLVSVLVGVTL